MKVRVWRYQTLSCLSLVLRVNLICGKDGAPLLDLSGTRAGSEHRAQSDCWSETVTLLRSFCSSWHKGADPGNAVGLSTFSGNVKLELTVSFLLLRLCWEAANLVSVARIDVPS